MAKLKTIYICEQCGYETGRWIGRCPSCGEFNTLVEDIVDKKYSKAKTKSGNPLALDEIDNYDDERVSTGIKELDRVFSGGVVQGSLILIGGDPGIGKSTLLLQVSENVKKKMLYVSGEESLNQIKLRAKRLGIKGSDILFLSETNLDTISQTIVDIEPKFVIIDSIQTMFSEDVSGSIGSVSQTRECVHTLMKIAKTKNITIFVVGHVTKDGAIAGPKLLEHMVDTVVYFEGEKNANFRMIRTVKNRFGSTNEIGVFEMVENGLRGVENPSAFMISNRPNNVSGSIVTCSVEGSRPILTEVQALVSKTNFGNPRRTATGIDLNRVQMLIAVLEKRVGLQMAELDSYVNIVGGMKITETAIDSAIICAIASSYKNRVVDSSIITFGEVGLTGELRSISNIEGRIMESIKLGFKKCVVPESAIKGLDMKKDIYKKIEIIGVSNVKELIIEVLK